MEKRLFLVQNMNLNNRINRVLHKGFQLEKSDENVFHKLGYMRNFHFVLLYLYNELIHLHLMLFVLLFELFDLLEKLKHLLI